MFPLVNSYYKLYKKIKEKMLKNLLIISLFVPAAFSKSEASLIELIKKDATVKNVKFAIDKGMDVNEKNKDGHTALMTVLNPIQYDFTNQDDPFKYNNHSIKILKLLLESGAKVNARNNRGQTALMIAAIEKNLKAMSLLVKAGSDTNLKDDNGDTVLINLLIVDETSNNQNKVYKKSYQYKLLKVLKLLIESKVDINVRNQAGQTALMYTVGFGSLDLVKLLLEAGADVNARDNEGQTALMSFATFKNSKVVDLLIKAGAEVNARNQRGQTALSCVYLYKESFLSLGLTEKDITNTAQILIKAGAIK